MSQKFQCIPILASTSIEATCHWFICLFCSQPVMRLLFVCVGNSCRSQMAEGIARSLGHDAASAGTHPASSVSVNALKVLESKGISTQGLHPKLVDDIDWQSYDMVISMGCGVSCPMIRIDQDWNLEDPVGQSLEVFEACAETIENHIKNLGS